MNRSRHIYTGLAVVLCLAVVLLAQAAWSQIRIPPSPQEKETRFNSDLRAVINLIRSGDYQRAFIILDSMQKTYGDDPRIDMQKKQIYRQAKMYPEFEELVRGQLAKSPNDPMLLTELGEARYLQDDKPGADSLWNLVIAGGKQNEAAYRYVADSQLRYSLYDDAIATYLRGRKNLSNASAFSLELASIYEIQRDYPKAVNEYLVQLQASQDKLVYVSTRIRGLLEDSENADDILKIVKQNIQQSPGRAELYEIMGDLYIKLGKMDMALENYKTIGSRLNDDGQSLVRFAVRCYDSKAYSTAIGAIDEYFKATKKAFFKDQALLVKAKSQEASGLMAEALGNYRELYQNAPDYRIKDEAGLAAGILYVQKNNCDSAMMIWRGMLKTTRTPATANLARLEMTVCYIRTDELARAESLLIEAALDKASGAAERAQFLMGDIAFFRGDIEKARVIFNTQIRDYPQGAFANDALMRLDVITLSGDEEGEKPYLVRFAQAMKAQVLGQYLESAAILSDSLFDRSPISEQASFYSAGAYARAGEKQKALDGYQGYIDKYLDGLYIDRAYLGMGDIYLQDPATYGKAKAAFNTILETYPDSPAAELARERLVFLETPGKIG